MAQVIVRENESLESALKRFKRLCARDGVMAEVRVATVGVHTQPDAAHVRIMEEWRNGCNHIFAS